MSATARRPHATALVAIGEPELPARGTLAGDLLAHLDAQLESAGRMEAIVSAQAGAIRRRAVREVVAAAGELQVEMHRRELIERDRLELVRRAADALGRAPHTVGISHIIAMLEPDAAALARDRTETLRRRLTEIDREHSLNRALLAQELAFLDHLLSLAGGSGSYAATVAAGAAAGGEPRRVRRDPALRRRVFDLEA